jgi:hypothetical protein
MKPQIVIYGEDYKLKLIVESWPNPETSPEWAAEFRGNFLHYRVIPRSPYFLLATPGSFFLWTDAETADETALPDYCVHIPSWFNTYLNRPALSPDRLSKDVWGYIVESWLNDIVKFNGHRNKSRRTSNGWLIPVYIRQSATVRLPPQRRHDRLRGPDQRVSANESLHHEKFWRLCRQAGTGGFG